MSLLVVGMSHRTAPVALLERAGIGPDDVPKALADLVRSPHVAEALVLSTCNRIELYAEVDRFHGGVHDLTVVLARGAGAEAAGLGPNLYARYEDAAVEHLFSVAAGLDSMVVGESQILGQVRAAYQVASEEDAVGRVMHELCQRALRVGKLVRSETGIDQVGASLVTAGLDAASAVLGPISGRSALVVGAGSMGALAAATLRRAGVADLTVANRTVERARTVAGGGRAIGLDGLEEHLREVDLVVTSTGAAGTVLPFDLVERAIGAARPARPLVLLDLAVPRDVDPEVATLPGVTHIDLDVLGAQLAGTATDSDVTSARGIVAAQVAEYLAERRSWHVTPTVAALRARAAEVVESELRRLDGRLTDLEPSERAEIARTVRRVVDKLLHAPTVRVKELAARPDGYSYARALRELFELDPAATRAVAVPSSILPAEPGKDDT